MRTSHSPTAIAHFAGMRRATRINEDGYVEGAPELIFEIAASSASIDTNEKKDGYRDAGTREYIVWRTEEHSLDWWTLKDGDYVEIQPDEDGILRSRFFSRFVDGWPGNAAGRRPKSDGGPEPRPGQPGTRRFREKIGRGKR